MFVFGGEGERTHVLGLTPTAYGYDPRVDRWTRLSDLPIAVHGLKGSAVIGGRIFRPAGELRWAVTPAPMPCRCTDLRCVVTDERPSSGRT